MDIHFTHWIHETTLFKDFNLCDKSSLIDARILNPRRLSVDKQSLLYKLLNGIEKHTKILDLNMDIWAINQGIKYVSFIINHLINRQSLFS